MSLKAIKSVDLVTIKQFNDVQLLTLSSVFRTLHLDISGFRGDGVVNFCLFPVVFLKLAASVFLSLNICVELSVAD